VDRIVVIAAGLTVAIALGLAMEAGVTTRDAIAEHESCERVYADCRRDRDACEETMR
jgi:hypothetical protein